MLHLTDLQEETIDLVILRLEGTEERRGFRGRAEVALDLIVQRLQRLILHVQRTNAQAEFILILRPIPHLLLVRLHLLSQLEYRRFGALQFFLDRFQLLRLLLKATRQFHVLGECSDLLLLELLHHLALFAGHLLPLGRAFRLFSKVGNLLSIGCARHFERSDLTAESGELGFGVQEGDLLATCILCRLVQLQF